MQGPGCPRLRPTLEIAGSVDLLALRRSLGVERAPALLHSAAPGPLGGFDVLPLVAGPPLCVPAPGSPGFDAALAQFQQAIAAIPVGGEEPADGLPFRGGWLIFLAYDLVHRFEPSLGPPRASALGDPLALLWRAPAALVYEHAASRLHLLAEEGCQELLDPLMALIGEGRTPACASLPSFAIEEDPAQDYLDGVARIHEWLRAGDVFQVNLSRGWRARAAGPCDVDALYRALCRSNPAPFAALLEHAGWTLLSSSPERLLRIRGRRIDTRPIAGTRRRDSDPLKDAALLAELRRDPKERAEHIMLIDLERNDLGRVAERGSVVVDELGCIESYAHVHHLVSSVSARLRRGLQLEELLRAVFPGGTITGCPKIRCMQIIAELESQGRGAYTGSLGLIGNDGRAELNILIRSLTLREGELALRAGAGIVADSDAGRELAETRAKALGLLRALG